MTMRRTEDRAFTLIELMIVCSIVAAVAASLVGMIGSISDSRVHLRARIDMHEDSARALSRWKEDVSLASSLEIGESGQSMSLVRRFENGRVATVRYHLSPEGHLLREADGAGEQGATPFDVIARNVSDLSFGHAGRGFVARWTVNFSDGIRTFRWPQTGFATPLAPIESSP